RKSSAAPVEPASGAFFRNFVGVGLVLVLALGGTFAGIKYLSPGPDGHLAKTGEKKSGGNGSGSTVVKDTAKTKTPDTDKPIVETPPPPPPPPPPSTLIVLRNDIDELLRTDWGKLNRETFETVENRLAQQ